MSAPHRDKPDLGEAGDTDEVYRLAYELAAWGLRNGECDEYDAADWVLGHSHETLLPRGSSGRLNPTQHHITKGAEAAVEKYEPWMHKSEFEPEPLHALAERIAGSGVTHERYLLGAIALCHRYQTFTPVITGPLLAGAVGVADAVAGRVLNEWGSTLAYRFFTGVTYDGERGHGRVWTVDPGWEPVSKPKHLLGCNRSTDRCGCPGIVAKCRRTGDLSFAAVNDRSPRTRQTATARATRRKHLAGCNRSRSRCVCPQPETTVAAEVATPPVRDIAGEFASWLETLERRAPLTVAEVARQLGVTRAAATKLLRAQQGNLLDEFTHLGGMKRKRTADGTFSTVRTGETWFVGRP